MKKCIFLIFLLSLINLSFAQKPDLSGRNLEIDNLKTVETEFTGFKKSFEKKTTGTLLLMRNLNTIPDSPRQKAIRFTKNYLSNYSKPVKDITVESKIVFETESPVGYHYRLNHMINNIPVYGSNITISVNKNTGEISSTAASVRKNILVNTDRPNLNENSAIHIAEEYLSASSEKIYQDAELVYFETRDFGTRLAFLIKMVPHIPLGDWRVVVDAVTGEILHVKDVALHSNNKTSDGKGYIWDPDPLTTAEVTYGGEYIDNNDTTNASLDNERIEVTLRDLTKANGKFILSGPYVKLTDLESPNDIFPELADSSQFKYDRSQMEFEDVMVYYHIDKSYRRIMQLGFSVPGLLEFKADPHGLNGQDNSHYISSANFVAFGQGGVDDAEDADVIWHEYEHAIQENITGGMDYVNETWSIQEGSSDYWAASYSKSISDYDWYKVFTWDGHNPFWSGRIASLSPEVGHYPEYYYANPGHTGGQIWSSALMEIWDHLGRDITDRLFLQAHYLWGSSPGFRDAAEAFLQADHDLYGSEHFNIIYSIFESRGLVIPNNFKPTIVHTPSLYTEDLIGPYRITAEITENIIPIDQSSFQVLYKHNMDSTYNSLPMTRVDLTDEYFVDIPAADTTDFTVWYYISAANDSGWITTHPHLSPLNSHSFRVFIDSLPPDIVHTPFEDQSKIEWAGDISATITDNLAVDSAWVEYIFHGSLLDTSAIFFLNKETPTRYSGNFSIDTNFISNGDSIYYRIFANDKSISQNIGQSPNDSLFAFKFTDPVSGIGEEQEENPLPNKYELRQNYPNPFNPNTTISFSIPVSANVKVNIYNVTGQLVKRLISADLTAGNHQVFWDAQNDHGSSMPSGIYFYRLQANGKVFTKRMLLIK